MTTNLYVFLVAWAVLVFAVAALAVYRKFVATGEDDTLHVAHDDAAIVGHQAAVAQRLDWIDRWGKGLTLAAALWGIALAAIFLYQKWIEVTQY